MTVSPARVADGALVTRRPISSRIMAGEQNSPRLTAPEGARHPGVSDRAAWPRRLRDRLSSVILSSFRPEVPRRTGEERAGPSPAMGCFEFRRPVPSSSRVSREPGCPRPPLQIVTGRASSRPGARAAGRTSYGSEPSACRGRSGTSRGPPGNREAPVRSCRRAASHSAGDRGGRGPHPVCSWWSSPRSRRLRSSAGATGRRPRRRVVSVP